MTIEITRALDKVLSADVTTPCPYHPSGRNHLLLSPLEREVIIERIEKVLLLHFKGAL